MNRDGWSVLRKLLAGFTLIGGSVISISLVDFKMTSPGTVNAAPESEVSQLRAEMRSLREELSRSRTNTSRPADESRPVPGESAQKENSSVIEREYALKEAQRILAQEEAAKRAALAAEEERLSRQRLELEAQRAEIAAREAAQRRAEQDARHREVSTALGFYASALDTFWRGNYSETVTLLSQAITHHPQDARFFYFRGLAYSRLGNRESAESDFRVGGTTEGRYSPEVSAALERIQKAHGWHERDWLETFRPRNR